MKGSGKMTNSVIVEAGNCIYCGRHIDDGSDIFLCEECRKRMHEKLKDGATATARPKDGEQNG